jgi:hypothetical protein
MPKGTKRCLCGATITIMAASKPDLKKALARWDGTAGIARCGTDCSIG